MSDSFKLKELKKKAHELEPVVRIGKNGLTDSLISEIKKNLEKKKLIKIRLLKSINSDRAKRREIALEVAKKTNAEIVSLVGGIIALSKK